MINTELSLFVARTETELNHIHDKLRLLLILADENATEDCVDTAENMVNDISETAKAAAMRIDSLGSKMWSLLYNLEKELADKKAAAAAEAAMKAATNVVIKTKPALETAKAEPATDPMGIGKAFSKIGAALNGAEPAPETETAKAADAVEGGELNG